jgi:hypothetical protein
MHTARGILTPTKNRIRDSPPPIFCSHVFHELFEQNIDSFIRTEHTTNDFKQRVYFRLWAHWNYYYYGSTALCWAAAAFSVFLILYTDGMTPLTGYHPVARPLPTHRINAHIHPCLEWDSNPRPQRSSERRQLMPQTVRPVIGSWMK